MTACVRRTSGDRPPPLARFSLLTARTGTDCRESRSDVLSHSSVTTSTCLEADSYPLARWSRLSTPSPSAPSPGRSSLLSLDPPRLYQHLDTSIRPRRGDPRLSSLEERDTDQKMEWTALPSARSAMSAFGTRSRASGHSLRSYASRASRRRLRGTLIWPSSRRSSTRPREEQTAVSWSSLVVKTFATPVSTLSSVLHSSLTRIQISILSTSSISTPSSGCESASGTSTSGRIEQSQRVASTASTPEDPSPRPKPLFPPSPSLHLVLRLLDPEVTPTAACLE